MAEMQQSMVADSEARQQLAGQVVQWEENLERLHCEQFRLRCYMASLQSGELPNPKVRENSIFEIQALRNQFQWQKWGELENWCRMRFFQNVFYFAGLVDTLAKNS